MQEPTHPTEATEEEVKRPRRCALCGYLPDVRVGRVCLYAEHYVTLSRPVALVRRGTGFTAFTVDLRIYGSVLGACVYMLGCV